MAGIHEPVLLEGVINNLISDEACLFVDATLGGGGHAYAILEKYEKVKLIGVDADREALDIARVRLHPFRDRMSLIEGNFRDLQKILQSIGISSIGAVLFDLGISHYQLGAGRGFSFADELELDMRIDRREKITAYDVVNRYSYKDLKRILEDYGEEEKAAKIAKAIVDARRKGFIQNAKELSGVVARVKRRRGKIHPATKTFQAIRMEVNRELANLETALPDAIRLLQPGGRIGVISFHSLEDRIVKNLFKASAELDILTKKPIRAERAEILRNPSARSAKLRIGTKRIDNNGGTHDESRSYQG